MAFKLCIAFLGAICCVCVAQPLHPVELEALQAIKRELNGMPGSSFLSTWDFDNGRPCGSFSGVACTVIGENSHITMLNLGDAYAGSPGLTGKLSHRLGDLTLLQQLTLVPGTVGGTLPKSISNLTSLEFIGISHNRLSGCIPQGLARLTNLQVIDLNSNLFGCQIPAGLGTLPNLITLELSHNKLVGPVPTFAQSSALTHLDLSWNKLSGEIPGKLPTSLTYVNLKMNGLTGSVVNALSSLHDLTVLDMSSNEFNGDIPSSVFVSNPRLLSLQLQKNRFTGPIKQVETPQHIAQLIDLSYNNLSGSIPALFALGESVYLNNNRFTGSVPHEFAKGLLTANLRNLFLQHNFLTGFTIDGNAALPAASLLCIDYNCLSPPSQSGCPLEARNKPSSSRPLAQCQEILREP